jgi:plasmid stabilization system protein ParE
MPLSNLTLHLTAEAEHDLEQVLMYSLIHWGESQMLTRAATFEAAFARISAFPEIAELHFGAAGEFRRLLVPPHVVIYRRIGDEIFVVSITHQREVPRKRL